MLEALLTPSWPSCCSNVNKQGERASGVIRPKGGGSLPSIIIAVSVRRLYTDAFSQIS